VISNPTWGVHFFLSMFNLVMIFVSREFIHPG
jgi:hypothetical protein